MMIATLIGSTGLTGSFLVQQLLADSTITEVTSVSREPINVSNPKLTAIESKIRGDIYFCCLGTTIKAAGSKENFAKVDHDAIVEFARIAKTHDAQSFTLVSAMSANANSMVFYSQVKGRTENDVKGLDFRSLVIFRPGLLVGPRREFRLGESIATKTLVPLSRLFPTRLRKSLITEAETLATRMLVEGKAAPLGVHVILAKDI
jgi:uncharacterized protein YbjT (DUF2867 family)